MVAVGVAVAVGFVADVAIAIGDDGVGAVVVVDEVDAAVGVAVAVALEGGARRGTHVRKRGRA